MDRQLVAGIWTSETSTYRWNTKN